MLTRRPLLLLPLAAVLACQRTPVARIDPLPGADPFPPALTRTLGAALGAKGTEYTPRTRHRRDDGSPRFTNRLLLDPSPYLQQHAHNPVDWYAWGPEAFAKARSEAKPILLSVGYSTCHWCHVMEEESFEDEEIATFLNQRYVAIKVDREVRPDIDDAYMGAVQLVSGRGGWPMTVWLTPQGEPFYADTYMPARDGERGVRVGFLTLLRKLRDVFDTQPERVAAQGATIAARVRELSAPAAADELPGAPALHAAFARFAATFDPERGGFGRAPKFPTAPALDFLLRYARHAERPPALDMVTRTLDRMAAGGIHDHVGGGFHRYATDAAWLVPHFEKMLYDNAQLANVYLAAFQATGEEQFAVVTRDILDYVVRDMTAPGGAFWAATDADSEGEEGRFFVWTPTEIRSALDATHAEAVLAYYAIGEPGNFAGRSILHTPHPLADVAHQLAVEPARLQQRLDEARAQLYTVRARRPPPHTDTKIVTGWNGLMIGAFARGGAVLGRSDYVERAQVAARFVLDEMRPSGRLQRVHAAGSAHEDAFLDDYAFLAAGLVDLYEATFDPRWLREAVALHDVLARDFWDAERGGFFLTSADREALIARQKPDADGALPSGNAVAALTLLRLAELTTDDGYRRRADALLRALGKDLESAPSGAPALLGALDFRLDRVKEVVIVHPGAARDGAAVLLGAVRSAYVPNLVIMLVADGARNADLPLTHDKRALNGVATAYVCEQRVCALPTSDPTVLARQLARVAALPGS